MRNQQARCDEFCKKSRQNDCLKAKTGLFLEVQRQIDKQVRVNIKHLKTA